MQVADHVNLNLLFFKDIYLVVLTVQYAVGIFLTFI